MCARAAGETDVRAELSQITKDAGKRIDYPQSARLDSIGATIRGKTYKDPFAESRETTVATGYLGSLTSSTMEAEQAEFKQRAARLEAERVELAVWRGALCDTMAALKRDWPENLAAWFAKMPVFNQKRFFRVIKGAIDNPDCALGCFAMQPNDYETFSEFFDRVVLDLHDAHRGTIHRASWNLGVAHGLPADGKLDVTRLGLRGPVPMRVHVCRNVVDFPPPSVAFEIAQREPEHLAVWIAVI